MWWFIKALRDYIEMTKDEAIWNIDVKMKFLDDDEPTHNEKLKKGESKTYVSTKNYN